MLAQERVEEGRVGARMPGEEGMTLWKKGGWVSGDRIQ
jgi:hypothetical protein